MNNSKRFFCGLTFILMLSVTLSLTVYGDDYNVCLDCHDGMAETLLNTPHELAPDSKETKSIIADCRNCHDGWQKHIEDPSADNIDVGSDLSPAKQAEVCGRCHITPHQMAISTDDPHSKAYLSCSSCHQIHNNLNRKLVRDDTDNYCASCHPATVMEFQQRSAHPLESANIRCIDCHGLESIGVKELTVGFDWGCQSCHEGQSGPYLYEHPVVYNHLVEGGSCTECHEPHGSVNDRLLTQPSKTLCLQCHGTPPGHLTAHSALGSKRDCVQCHSEVHGSFSNRLLLDPDLGMKLFPDCYQSGCHSLGG